MAGHSHWANIARKKSVVDAKRGKVFSKLSQYYFRHCHYPAT